MGFLIDTHILIWYLDGDKRLSNKIRQRIDDENNSIIISVASLWEIAIKLRLEKLNTKITLSEIQLHIAERNFKILNISFKHLNALSKLSHHHGDPFDHLIIAQAIAEELVVISADRHFSAYPVEVVG
jgi:PIN domain nuclease of toxin-antitoxin system